MPVCCIRFGGTWQVVDGAQQLPEGYTDDFRDWLLRMVAGRGDGSVLLRVLAYVQVRHALRPSSLLHQQCIYWEHGLR